MKAVIWDIETGPLEESVVRQRVNLRLANTPESEEKQAKFEQAVSLAALTPETGQVLAIGYGYYSGGTVIIGNGDGEKNVLQDFGLAANRL